MQTNDSESGALTLDSLRTSNDELEKILNALDLVAQANRDASNGRVHERHRYRQTIRVRARIIHPGGTTATFAVKIRNLSVSGMGFLHGSFLHNDTLVRAFLITRAGVDAPVDGRVVRARVVRGTVHEIGVKFDAPIRLADFIAGHVDEPADPAIAAAEPPAPGAGN